MKTFLLRGINQLLILTLTSFLLSSCEKDDPFIQTDKGLNTLGFFANNEKVEYAKSCFSTEYGMEWYNDVSGKIFNDTLVIVAKLSSLTFDHIIFNIPVEKLGNNIALKNVTKQFEVYMPYLYWVPGDENGENKETITTGHRSLFQPTYGELNIRYYSSEKGIISGTFSLKGYHMIGKNAQKQIIAKKTPLEYGYEDIAEGKLDINITNGMFDVKIVNQDKSE